MKKLNKADKALLTCTVPGCGKVAKSPQGLKVHMEWQHNDASREKRMAAAKRVGDERAAANQNGTKPKRRPYVRKSKKLQHAANRSEVNFCPKCGTNLEAVSLAMGFTE